MYDVDSEDVTYDVNVVSFVFLVADDVIGKSTLLLFGRPDW